MIYMSGNNGDLKIIVLETANLTIRYWWPGAPIRFGWPSNWPNATETRSPSPG
jgi:hypothetical protein